MSDVTVATKTKIEDPFGPSDDWSVMDPVRGGALMPVNQTTQGEQDAVVVQIMRHATTHPRVMSEVKRRISGMATIMGEQLRYSWFVNDRRSGGKTEISGPTVKCAEMVAREYGNCYPAVRLKSETHTHWVFQGIFVDFETGYMTTRDFQQRKNQDTGMKDIDRQADIVFQIGQSKAVRNVIVHALSFYVDFALEQGRSRLIAWVTEDEGRAKAKIQEISATLGIEMKVLQGARGRVIANWTVQDTALTISELRAIQEGTATVEDIYGDPDVARKRADADEVERQANSAAAKAKVDGRTKEAREAKARAEAEAAAQAAQDTSGQPVGEANDTGDGSASRPTQAAEGEVAATPTEPARDEAQHAAQGGSAGENAQGAAGASRRRQPPPPAEPEPAAKPRPKMLFGDRDQ